MTKKDKKKKFRKCCLRQLSKVSHHGKYVKDKKILNLIYQYIQVNKAKNIMLYLPLDIEFNTYPLILRLRKEKKMLYVPFMEGKSFSLVKYRLPEEKKQFGIKEPKFSRQYKKRMIDMAIVPVVGVDLTHRRVGFGKGMYDRFFEKYKQNIKQVVFVARELCYSKEVVTDHYDVRADIIITAR
ncbi:MAG: 5-formyltetrahydrofolate cyclo-ligase [Epsilonproteobacteria bacterium]|nr:MAG: 5-formyltetrahydrofolate cyclo-ligase [Campylobacterota bacterium]